MTDHSLPGPTLPDPTAARWTPLRLGLVDIFHYGTEEFAFHDGRLLLRGNNGTGKSKVLALTLPYLLDGDASAQRVEPDRDPGKRMEWNLLLGGRHTDRLGYTWIEFGRIEEGGTPRFTTLLCGMKAVQGKGIAKKWFAITSRRMGEGLHLVDRSGLALSQPRLRDLLGTDGRVVEGVEQWRRTVDEALFGLGEARYDAMIALLIQLRQPQLSRRPDEAALDAALTEALPPLDQAVVAAVADAMRNLEDERTALAALATARRTLTRFTDRYRRYARTALHRRESEVRSRQSIWERSSVALRDARQELEEATAEEARVTAAHRDADGERRDLEVARTTVERSQGMQDAVRLDDARTAATRAREVAERADRDLTAAQGRLAARRTALAEATAALHAAADRAGQAAEAAAMRAGPVGLAGAVLSHADPVAAWVLAQVEEGAEAIPAPDVAAAAAGLDVEVLRRRDAVAEVRRLAREASAARAVVTRLEADRDRAARAREASAEHLAATTRVLGERGEAHAAATQGWVAALRELALPDAVELLDVLDGWVGDPTGRDPLADATDAGGRAAAAALAEARLVLVQRRDTLHVERAEAVAERDRLAAGVDPAPAPSPARATGDRADHPGAPLWQLLEFADGVDPPARAGIEAALEGAGLLDALVTPDGALADPAWRDAGLAEATPNGLPAQGSSLTTVLRGVQGQAVPASTVGWLLSGIGYGPATADSWIAPDGRYRIGTIEGAWSKAEAVHIGAAARRAARTARIAELDGLIDGLDDRITALEAQTTELDERRRQLDDELSSRPDPAGVVQAAERRDGARDTLTRDEDTLRRTEAVLAEGTATARRSEELRNTTAVQLGLPVDEDALAEVTTQLDGLALHLGATLWPACRESVAETRRRDAERQQLVVAEAELTAQQTHLEAAVREQRDLDTTAEQLAALVGATVEEAQRELARVQASLTAVRSRLRELAEQASAAARRTGTSEGRIEGLEQTMADRRTDRDAAVDALRRAVEHGILAAALPGTEAPQSWAADPAVRFARQITGDLEDVDPGLDAWNAVQAGVARGITELQSDLSVQGGSADQELVDDLLVVTVRYWGQAGAAHQLAGVLMAEVAERETLLSAQERELIENHLVDEAGAQLGERIRAAEAQVAAMNDQLVACATSTGMTLRLRWVAGLAAPAAMREAMGVLRQTHQLWGPQQRGVLGELLQTEIERAREGDEHGTWTDHLTQALDYRRWFSFLVERGEPGGGWRRASGPASGGERVLAATLPLFAAAASHYTSARADSPRLVLLDEAFAGVDDTARRACMGLLTAFDLDCVLTSEREWGCYPEVPGLAICHLVRRDGIDAVLVSRWRWDGASRSAEDDPPDTARQRSDGVDAVLAAAADLALFD